MKIQPSFNHPIVIKKPQHHPIRITEEYRFLNRTWYYEDYCQKIGQIITTRKGNTYICQEEDVFTELKIQVVQKTIENIKNYLQTYIKVNNPTQGGIPVHSVQDLFEIPNGEDYTQQNSDFHIVLVG
jgi:hypothetical protein